MKSDFVIQKKRLNSNDFLTLLFLLILLIVFVIYRLYILVFFVFFTFVYCLVQIIIRIKDKESKIIFSKNFLCIHGNIDHFKDANISLLWRDIKKIEIHYADGSFGGQWLLYIFSDDDVIDFHLEELDINLFLLKKHFDQYMPGITKFTKNKGSLILNWSKYKKANQGIYI